MTKEQMIEAIYKEITNKLFSTNYFLFCIGLFLIVIISKLDTIINLLIK